MQKKIFSDSGIYDKNFPLKACIAEQLLSNEKKTDSIAKVLTRLNCTIVETEVNHSNPYGFMIEMKGSD